MEPTLLAVLLFVALGNSRASNILLLGPPQTSHMQQQIVIGNELVKRGHQVSFVAPTFARDSPILKDTKINIVWYEIKHEMNAENDPDYIRRIMNQRTPIAEIIATETRYRNVCDVLMADDKLYETLKTTKFDFAITDGFLFMKCTYILLDRLELPYATVVTVKSPLQFTTLLAVPALRLSTFSPVTELDFAGRLANTLRFLNVRLIFAIFDHSSSRYEKYCRTRPCQSYQQLEAASKFWLIDIDEIIEGAAPSMPHVFNVGGLSLRPPKQLTGKFLEIADAARDSLVLVSFGGSIAHMDEVYLRKMFDVMGALPQYTFIFRTKSNPTDVPDNVNLFPWLPQRDILSHKNLRLFITHCGMAGLHETHAGVPILGIPLFAEQPMNAAKIERQGFGLRVSLTKSTVDEMVASIKEVINNPKYRDTMQKKSKIFRSKKFAVKRAGDVIEHVLEHGSDHLQPLCKDLYWFQLLMFDVAAVFILVPTMFLIICYYCCCRCRRCSRDANAKRKSE